MNRIYYFLLSFLFIVPALVSAQQVKYSDFDRQDSRDMHFEIIGKVKNNILVYKNVRSNHKIKVFDSEMNTLETVKLDFVPDKTFNIDFVSFPDHFFMIYQYQKGNILHCMAVKMDAMANKMSDPVELDTTRIPVMASNKIYSTISSEDKQRIMIFKIQTRYQKFNMKTMLFDSQMKLISSNRYLIDYDERKENYDNFSLTNDGDFVFTIDKQAGNRDNSNKLSLIIKRPDKDTFVEQVIELDKIYIDEVNLKVDNRNKRFIINSFYYKKNRGNIEGLFTYVWDMASEKIHVSRFVELYDSLRAEAKRSGMLRYALDNFFIRQVIVKGDGGFILAAEDYENQINNNFNRYDYLYNRYSYSGGFYYDPFWGHYRPFGGTRSQSSRSYFENILVFSYSKAGLPEWSKVIHKSQFGDNEEYFMSFSTLTSGTEIHFLFNEDKRNQIISNQGLSPDGTLKRYPTLKNEQKAYEFMPSLSKQVGAKQIIIPCFYRNNICFAKVDF